MMNPLNPVDDLKDRCYLQGRLHKCRYCHTLTNGNQRDYRGERHTAECPVGQWIENRKSQKELF